MKEKENVKNRILYLDVIRVIACFLVVMVHVSAQHIYDLPPGTFFFGTHAAFECLGFSGVALYFMISGSLLLDAKKEVTIRGTLRRVLHFFFLYFFWKLVYYLFTALCTGKTIDFSFLKTTLADVFRGRPHYHLWFLSAIAIVYLFVPLIKKSVENNPKICLYYVGIFFTVDVLFRTFLMFDTWAGEILRGFLNYNDFFMFTGYLGYFVWGHYLHQYGDKIPQTARIVLYVLAIAMLPLAGLADTYFSVSRGIFDVSMNTPMSLTSFITVTAIFLFVKNMCMPKNEKACKIIGAGSRLTFGVYLLHPMILVATEKVGFSSILFSSVISLPVVTIAVTLLTALPVSLLIKIPVIRKTIT